MDTRTQRPARTSPGGGAPPRAGRAGPIVLAAIVVALVLTAAVLVSVLYGADAGTTPPSQPQPGVSAVQLERWAADDAAEQLDREVQRFRNAVDVARSR